MSGRASSSSSSSKKAESFGTPQHSSGNVETGGEATSSAQFNQPNAASAYPVRDHVEDEICGPGTDPTREELRRPKEGQTVFPRPPSGEAWDRVVKRQTPDQSPSGKALARSGTVAEGLANMNIGDNNPRRTASTPALQSVTSPPRTSSHSGVRQPPSPMRQSFRSSDSLGALGLPRTSSGVDDPSVAAGSSPTGSGSLSPRRQPTAMRRRISELPTVGESSPSSSPHASEAGTTTSSQQHQGIRRSKRDRHPQASPRAESPSGGAKKVPSRQESPRAGSAFGGSQKAPSRQESPRAGSASGGSQKAPSRQESPRSKSPAGRPQKTPSR